MMCFIYTSLKALIDFLCVIIRHFSVALTAEALNAKISPNRCSNKGVGHFEAK